MLLAVHVFAENLSEKLSHAALARTKQIVIYNGRYVKIPYPNGDVHFSKYPSKRLWGLKTTDSNIDHRRVPNLRVFFQRNGKSLPVSQNGKDYHPGDLVTWMLPGNLPHIGIVTDKIGKSGNPKVVHNIGFGPKLNDSLFDYKITGHYRYFPKNATA